MKSQKLYTEMHECNNSAKTSQLNPHTHPARTDLVQVDCTRKQVAYQMFSSASHLTEIYRVLKITAGKWDNCPAAVKQTSTRWSRDKVNPNESTRDANEEEQTTLVSSLCPMKRGSLGSIP